MEIIGAAPLVASSGNVAAAVAAATLSGVADKTTYLSGFQVNGTGATGTSTVLVTITGLVGGTLTFPLVVVAGAGLPNQPMNINFAVAIPATAPNTAIVVSCPSLGAGNLNNAVNAQGFRL